MRTKLFTYNLSFYIALFLVFFGLSIYSTSYAYIQSFDGYNLGNLVGQDSWILPTGVLNTSPIVQNTVTFGSSGKALLFKAVDEVLRVPIAQKTTSYPSTINISFWVKQINPISNCYVGYQINRASPTHSLALRMFGFSGQEKIELYDGSILGSITGFTPDVWHYIYWEIADTKMRVTLDRGTPSDWFTITSYAHTYFSLAIAGITSPYTCAGYIDNIAEGEDCADYTTYDTCAYGGCYWNYISGMTCDSTGCYLNPSGGTYICESEASTECGEGDLYTACNGCEDQVSCEAVSTCYWDSGTNRCVMGVLSPLCGEGVLCGNCTDQTTCEAESCTWNADEGYCAFMVLPEAQGVIAGFISQFINQFAMFWNKAPFNYLTYFISSLSNINPEENAIDDIFLDLEGSVTEEGTPMEVSLGLDTVLAWSFNFGGNSYTVSSFSIFLSKIGLIIAFFFFIWSWILWILNFQSPVQGDSSKAD